MKKFFKHIVEVYHSKRTGKSFYDGIGRITVYHYQRRDGSVFLATSKWDGIFYFVEFSAD